MASIKITPYLIFRIIEFVLGGICFGLFAYYELFIPVSAGNQTKYRIIVKFGIDFVAADAFPFIVQIPFLIAYLVHGKKFQHNILNPIVNLIGCIVYLTSGAMSLSVIVEYNRTPDNAVGSMFVITAIVYFADLIFWMVKLRKVEH